MPPQTPDSPTPAAPTEGRGQAPLAPESHLTTIDAARLAQTLWQLFDAAQRQLNLGSSGTLDAVEAHLGCPLVETFYVRADVQRWEAASATRALMSYIAEFGSSGEVFGLGEFAHEPLRSALASEAQFRPHQALFRPAYDNVPVSPTETEGALVAGLVCTVTPSGDPTVLAVRKLEGPMGPTLGLEALARTRESCEEALAEVQRRMELLDVARGQVVTFTSTEYYGNDLVDFLPRPAISADEVILPDGVLDRVRTHVLSIGRRADDLHALGLHLKRGILLHGAPGTGKTHLVRHLIGSTDATVVVLTGSSLARVGEAAALARRLAPSIVVCEDVDLVAMDRDLTPGGNPALFTLLDAIDGVAGEADVTFILTTNRVEDLELALAQRPGRVDLAVEIPLPDADARAALLRLYSGRLTVTADLAHAADALDGLPASAMKEIMRRAAMVALDQGAPVVDDTVLGTVVEEFLADTSAVTRALLGGDPSAPGASAGDDWLAEE